MGKGREKERRKTFDPGNQKGHNLKAVVQRVNEKSWCSLSDRSSFVLKPLWDSHTLSTFWTWRS